MSAGFTPGPWRVAKAANFKGEILASDGLTVATAKLFVPEFRKSSDANANLIAAAPELYEALKALLDNLNEFGAVSDGELLEQADAALAKARGEG